MIKRLVIAFILVFFGLAVNGNKTIADVYSEYQSTAAKLSELRATKDSLAQELNTLAGQMTLNTKTLAELGAKIATATKTLAVIETSLSDRRSRVDTQENLRNEAVRDYYKQGEIEPLILFISADSWADLSRRWVYFQSLAASVKNNITGLNEEIKNFEANKKEAEALKRELTVNSQQLTVLQNRLTNQAGEIKDKLSQYAREEAILGERLGALSAEISSQMSWQQSAALSVKESGAGRSNTPNPDGAPSWRITGYGTEHGVGMSQWGAFMKAAQGWDAEKILKFYYQDVSFTTVETSSISVSGYGSLNFEDEYLAGIGETDPVWYTINKNAAEVMDRVQVIAARTYAYRYAKNGQTICVTQACQVYVGGTAKKEAVEKTRGVIMTRGGEPITAFYFSTSGPHTDDIGDSPSFAFNNKTREYKSADNLNSSYPYLRAVEFNDTASPFNNWSAIIPNSWRSQAFPPRADNRDGTPIGQIDMTDVLNTALLNTSNLERVDSRTSMEEVCQMLKAEGKTPLEGLKSVNIIKMGGSSDRVKWVTAVGSNRDVGEGEITGIRFRYAFNVRSPEKDWIYSTWFEFR